MKYVCIYHDKCCSVAIGKYETYGEAPLVMVGCRKWCHEFSCNPVRFEIWEDCYHG